MNDRYERLKARIKLTQRGIMPIMGGAPVGGSGAYPLGPPVVNPDGEIHVPYMLKQPTRITRLIQDLSLEQWISEYLFRSAGGVTGGAVIYDRPTENDLYSTRDFQQIEPGAEFPILTDEELIPEVATPEKWGGKVFITDEARDRNDVSRFMNQMRRLSNTIVRRLNYRAIEEVNDVLTEYTGQVLPGNDWSAVNILGTSPTPYEDQPIGDLVAIFLHNEQLEMPMMHDTLLINAQEASRLMLIYGRDWRAILGEYGYSTVFVSRQIEPGTALSIARGQLGQMHIESPLRTVTYREEGTERTWVQTGVRPLMYVNDPYAVVKLTGLAG